MTHDQTLPPLTKDLIEAFAASAVAWLLRLLGVLVEPSAARRRRRLTAFVRAIERSVECIIFLRAVHGFGPPPRRRSRRPASVAPGFRRTRGGLRLFWKSAGIRAGRRASLIERVAQLLAALAHPERYIARFTKALCAGLRHTHLIASAPPACACASMSCPPVAVMDSS